MSAVFALINPLWVLHYAQCFLPVFPYILIVMPCSVSVCLIYVSLDNLYTFYLWPRVSPYQNVWVTDVVFTNISSSSYIQSTVQIKAQTWPTSRNSMHTLHLGIPDAAGQDLSAFRFPLLIRL